MPAETYQGLRRPFMGCRYDGSAAGHYESYFLRANHPAEAKAFWIRYTLFSPKNRPRDAIGELWAVWFDGDAGKIAAVREEVPMALCSFDSSMMNVTIADAALREGFLQGRASTQSDTIGWNLEYVGDNRPVFLFHEPRYASSFPKAKALVGNPNVRFSGRITVNGTDIAIDGWQGSENHNWGAQHTDRYAWGQVAGFDNDPDAFLEVGSAQLKFGPVWTPMLTTMVLRHGGTDYAINGLPQMIRAKAGWRFFDWHFENGASDFRIRGHISAEPGQFVRLRYLNPPGGVRICFNCKIASAQVFLERRGKDTVRLAAKNRAAFEILTDEAMAGHVSVAGLG